MQEETDREILEENVDEISIKGDAHGPVKKERQCCFSTMKTNVIRFLGASR